MRPRFPVEAVQEIQGDAVLLQHHGDRLSRIEGGLACATAFGVGEEGASKPVSHMSRTITIFDGSAAALKLLADLRRAFLATDVGLLIRV